MIVTIRRERDYIVISQFTVAKAILDGRAKAGRWRPGMRVMAADAITETEAIFSGTRLDEIVTIEAEAPPPYQWGQ